MTYEEYKQKYKNIGNTQSVTKVSTYEDYLNRYKTPQNVSEQSIPTFKTPEEAQNYANQNNINVAGGVSIPKLTNQTSAMEKQIADIRKDHEGLSKKELKDTIDSYNKGTWGANYTLGDMQIKYNKAMSKYFESQDEKDLAEAEEIRNQINKYQKYASNVNRGNIITKDFAGYVPQLLGQTGAGIAGAGAGAVTGATAGAGIGSVIPGAGTAAGAGTGALWGAKAGYVGGVAKFGYDQMRGNAYAGLLDLGVPNDIALKVANDTALWQGIVEGAGAGIDLATLGIGKLFSKGAKTVGQLTAKKMLTDALKAYGINILSEAGEEAVQEAIAIQGEKKATEQAGIQREATRLDDAKRIAEAGIGGGKIALVSGGGNLVGNLSTNTINNIKTNKAQQNVTSQSPQIEQTQVTNEVIPSATQKQNTANVMSNNVNEQNIAQNQSNNENISQNNVQNAQDFEKTVQMEQSLGLQQSKEIPQAIQTFVENRNKTAPGLNIQFDNTLNTDGRIIRNPDGTRMISINPNSTRAYEFVVVHEMMHDLENTQEFQELSKYVKDRAITHEEFEKAKQAITEQYTKYYTENNLDMSGLNMDVETTNDMVAKALGNPQFLNELAGNKPNVFMRLYNWIKNVAFDGNKTGKTFSERRADNKYLQELKNKFETAYNTNYKGNASNKFSIQTRSDGTKYVKVDTDQNIFDGVATKDYNKVAKMYIEDYLLGKTKLAQTDTAIIDKTSSKKYTNPGKYQSEFETKMKLTPELKNVLEIAKKEAIGVPTKANSKYSNWEYYTFDFELGGKTFTGTINIGIDSNGNKHFYEINKIHPTVQRTGSDKSVKMYSNNSIPQTTEKIKNSTQSSFSLGQNLPETDNQGRELNGILEENNMKLRTNGSLEYSNLTNVQINKLVKIYQKNGYSDVSKEYLQEALKRGSAFVPREVADVFIKEALGYTPSYNTLEIYEDAEGNKLTKEQVEFYKDSDVRDIRGRLIPVYHSTNNDFTIFDSKASKQHGNKYGKGFYFSITPENYGNKTMKFYLNAKEGEYKYIPKMGYYVVQNNNAIKLIDNLNPTDDPDIRYTQSNNDWQKYLDKNWDLMPNANKTTPLMPSTEQLKAQDLKQGEEAYNTLNMKKPKLEDIAEITQEQAKLPSMSYKQRADKNTPYRRKFWDNVESSKIISKDVKEQVNMTNYERKHNADVLEKMKERLDAEPMKVAQEWFRKDIKKATDQDVALGAILMERYQAEGRFDEAVDVVEKLADMGTEAGRTVQMYSIFQRLTPEGMMIYQQRKLNSALETLTQKQTGKWVEQNKDKFRLTEDDTTFITAKVQEAQNAPTERQKQIALAEIETRINDKLPPEAGQSVKAFRRIAMLFNPKTQVRNVVGNMTVMPLNYVTDVLATGIDKIIAKKTGVRTTALPNIKTIAEGAKKGLSETIDDYKRGIRTTPTGSKYEIQNNVKSFNENTNSKAINAINKKLNTIDRILSSVMEGGDRPFYEASYQNALETQMKANGVTEPTQEMIDIASNVALSQTWQDNNNYTQAVLGIRSAFNKININGFGLGDLIIPFAKTPANLTKAMVDYSPAGFIPALINYNDMRKAISRGDMTAMQQKKFVTSVGKAMAGTILYAIAGALVKGGKITGSSDEDKDVANFEKNVLGIQPYSIKIGDKTFTYNWAQPLATPLAIMSDSYKMSEENAKWNEILVNAFKVAGDQLVANSFLQGIQELLSSEYGNESAMDNLVGAIMDLPTQFTPTLFGQIATQFDSTKRQTFENGDTVGTMINEVKNKIPGAKNTLAPQVNTFGEEIKNYGGDNNPFNVFLNPGNISSTNATDTQKELYALYEVTKDNTIFPRQAPYSVSGGGEKITLSSKDRADYQKTSGQYVTEHLDALFDSEFYKTLEDNKKVDVIAKIVSDADTTAKDKWVDTQATEKLSELKTELKESGIPLLDYYNAWIATQGIESDKNWKGETITNSKSKKQKEAIDKATPELDKWERRKLYEIFNVGKSVW